ncbi:MAG: energy-coupling factor transporter transmembrane protein EcfT [Spirochaetales bacterium]|nr:MAG: energy-coupling factor transporter transmembrane protein EcfT [Spirochaetales bacterium]
MVKLFTWYPGRSFMHRLDPRIKLLTGILTSWLVFGAGWGGLAAGGMLILVPVLLLTGSGALPAVVFLRYLKVFAPLLLLILISALFTETGIRASMPAAAVFALRLSLALLGSALFTSTTSISAVKRAVVSLLGPFPWVPKHRIGMMIGLSLTMVPRLLKSADDIREAQKARCAAGRRNPVARIRLFAVPLLISVTSQVEELAQAMEARCFSENRREAPLHTAAADWIWLGIILVFFGACMVLKSLGIDFF